jgi:hypothetical protein
MPEIESSKDFYSKIAEEYAEYKVLKQPYINSVDDIVCQILKDQNAKTWLDIGIGDGSRSWKILQASKNIKEAIWLDNCPVMIQKAKRRETEDNHISVIEHELSYTHLKGKEVQFVSMLWNVLLDVQVFVNLSNLRCWKKILILGIQGVCLRSKFFSALNLNKFPKNLNIES